jgi:hypothetical protein
MGYASICGKAVANVNSPVAYATCDRCASVYNHNQLRWQYDQRGRQLQNIRILVCARCEDEPAYFLKPLVLPPDPVSIENARPYPYCYAEEDDRYTTNPALSNVDLGTTANITLAGYQFVDGVQCVGGELVLVKSQTDPTKNGIYKVSSGLWVLQGYNNDTKKWFSVDLNKITYYGQLGYFQGAVNVARGLTQYAKLFQITFDPNALLATGTAVTAGSVSPSTVNHYDFYTGIYMEGADKRITEDGDTRTPQQVGQAAGNINEIPGFSNLVPGSCDIGKPTDVPYGCGAKQGLPPGFDSLPFSGPLWPTLQNQSIPVWMNYFALPSIWVNNIGMEVTFSQNGFWPNPGPGASFRPIAFGADLHQWVNNISLNAFWNNALNQNVLWRNGQVYGIFPPGGDILWKDKSCVATLWHNDLGNNVNWAEIYPNILPPNKPGPWPWGWL